MSNTVMDMREYNAEYMKSGALVWKKIGGATGKKGKRKKKTFPKIRIEKMRIPDGLKVDKGVLDASREQYKKSHEMIPVYLDIDFKLISGYEQCVLAEELGMTEIPFQYRTLRKMNRKERSNFAHHASEVKVGNKKYKLVKEDGTSQFVSAHQKKRFGQCKSKCSKYDGLKLCYVGDHKVRILDDSGHEIVSPKTCNSMNEFLDSRVFINGKFVKKSKVKE
ncbi:MAG: hypothetical protein PHW34_14045 [Hespellia sp.]|nr:hypothetical protein [Hespellia sp.]